MRRPVKLEDDGRQITLSNGLSEVVVSRKGGSLIRTLTVNGRKVDISSYVCRPGDVIGVRERGSNIERVSLNRGRFGGRGKPGWLQMQPDAVQIKVLAEPSREEISLPVQEQLIVELCSR